MTTDRSRELTLPIENTGKVCEIPKKSVLTQTHADLCELKTRIDMHHGSPSTLSGMIAFQKELDGIAPREIHENELFLYIQSPLAVQYRVTMKQGAVGTPKNTPFHFTFPDGQQATILRRDENGYNSEYEILFGDKPGTVLGVIFTITNPEIKVRRAHRERIEKKIAEKERVKQEPLGELGTLENLLHPKGKKLDAKKRKEWEERKIVVLQSIDSLNKDINALQYRTSTLNGEIQKFEKTQPLIAFPYSPYQSVFDTPDTRRIGMEYIGQGVYGAYKNIFQSDPSRAEDFRLHTPASVVLLLNVIERMDFHEYIDFTQSQSLELAISPRGAGKKSLKAVTIPAVVTKDQKTLDTIMESQMNRALTVFALNRSGAYNWQVSKVGAVGMAQLMPDTYLGLRKKHPGFLSNTPEDYYTGSKLHTSALQYQAVHVYDEYRQFPKWVGDNWDAIMQNPETRLGIYMILACGYNGTMSQVLREVGIISMENPDWPSLLKPENILNRFRTLIDPMKPTQPFKYAAERYTYALKFQYLYKRLGQDSVSPQR